MEGKHRTDVIGDDLVTFDSSLETHLSAAFAPEKVHCRSSIQGAKDIEKVVCKQSLYVRSGAWTNGVVDGSGLNDNGGAF
jgi:hypothetical protein